MKNLKKRLLSQKGFISIYSILLMCALLPLGLFLAIDLPYYMQYNKRLKSINDNAVSSAITMINEGSISSGNLYVNEDEAREIIYEILRNDLFLNEDLSPGEGSVLRDKPNITIKFVQNPGSATVVDTPAGDVKCENTSVVLYVEYKVRGVFFSRLTANIKQLSVSQAQFR